MNDEKAVSSGKYTFTNVTESQTIVVNFKYRTHAITATQAANGLITPEGVTEVNHGDNITYNIVPNAGYMIKTVLVNGKNNPSAVSSGFHTFTNVTAKQTISATFAPLAGGIADEESTSNEITLFPNPTTGQFTIENGQLKIENIEVYDMLGKKQAIFNCQLSAVNSIDISHLPAGVYFVRIQTETSIEIRKVVKN